MQSTIAVDLAKNVFQVAESQHPGRVSRKRRLSRAAFERYLGQVPKTHFLLEACGSSHYWGQRIESLGHTVALLPPHHVRRYRSGDKRDDTDAKALLEAHRNEEIHPVPVKDTNLQHMAALHRLRSGYQRTRVARLNAIRGLLRELGIIIPVGHHHVVPAVMALEEDTVSQPLKASLQEAAEEVVSLQIQITQVEHQLEALARQTPAVAQLQTVPGIGLITATALAAFVGDPRRFRNGRQFASYLGLTPKEHSSGNRRRLGGISKRGDVYLRSLLVHGARTVLRWAPRKKDTSGLHAWALGVERRRGRNIAIVALANKMARIAWTIWKEERDFRLAA